jgi:hypothetical protein
MDIYFDFLLMKGITIQGQNSIQTINVAKSLTLLVSYTIGKPTSTTISLASFNCTSQTMSASLLLVTSSVGSSSLNLSTVLFTYYSSLNAALISVSGVNALTFSNTSVTKVV